MSAERRPGPSRFEPSLRRLLLRLRLCLLLHPNEPLANLTLAPSLTMSLTLALTLTLALAKPPPASVFPKQHRLSFGRASPEAFQPSRVKLSPSRSGRGQRPPTSQPLHRHPKEKACAVIANEVPTEPLRSRERRQRAPQPGASSRTRKCAHCLGSIGAPSAGPFGKQAAHRPDESEAYEELYAFLRANRPRRSCAGVIGYNPKYQDGSRHGGTNTASNKQ